MNDATLKLYLLGKPHIELDGRPYTGLLAKAQALLYYLALEPGRHSRAALATLLWSEMPEERARGNLRTAMSRLQPHFGPFLQVTRSVIGLAEDAPVWVDALEFERGVVAPDPATQQAALALYRGELLADLQVRDAPVFEEWLLVARVRMQQLALDGLEHAARSAWQQGDAALALTGFRRLLALDAYREGAHRGIMRLLAAQGDRAGALAQFEQCRRVLADELGVEPAASTRLLAEAIRQGEPVVQPASPGARRPSPERPVQSMAPHNLPSPVTSFHGRSVELARIEEALGDAGCRLLTITGLGGAGKTRLAQAAAHQLRQDHPDWFPDGLYWVELAAVTGADGVIAGIAGAVGFSFSGAAPEQTQLFNYLRRKRMLLALDNLEQLVEVAPLLSDLLRAAPGVKLLATSRHKLNLYEEWRLPLDGLPFPAAVGEGMGEYEAVQLLAQRARRVNMAFDWRAQAEDAATLCRLLDGLPLGLELAAAWTHVFSLAEIAAAIARDQSELAVQWRNAPERHHSLEAVLATSWRLLGPEGQAVLARLAVFRQGFNSAAAEAVAGTDARLLAGLVEKSLVRPRDGGRFDLHQQVRQFAWTQLGAGQKEALIRHRDYFARSLGDHTAAVTGPDQASALQAINRDDENVQLAWSSAVQDRAVPQLSQMAAVLFHFYSKHGRQRQGFALFGEAVAMLQAGGKALRAEDERLLAACLVWQGRCGELIHQGFAEPERLLQRGLALARRHAMAVETAQALMGLGLLALIQGRLEESSGYLQESLEIAQRAAIGWTEANVLQLLAWLRASQGEPVQAQAMAQQAVTMQRKLGDLNGEAAALNTLGKVESDLGAYDRAESAYAHAWDLCRQTGHLVGQGQALTGLFGACMRQGKQQEALGHAQASLQVNQDAGNRLGEAIACHNLGYAYAAQGDHRQAADYYRRALALYEALGGNEPRIKNTRRYLEQSLQAAG